MKTKWVILKAIRPYGWKIERNGVGHMYTVSDYTPHQIKALVEICRKTGSRHVAWSPYNGEYYFSESERGLLYLFKTVFPSIRKRLDIKDQVFGCFLVVDCWGNVYYYSWDSPAIRIFRGVPTGEIRNGLPQYDWHCVQVRG